MHIYKLLKWIGKVLIWTFMHTFIIPVQGTDCDYDSGASSDSSCMFVDEKEEPLTNRSTIITRTRLYSCDQVIRLFSLSPSIKNRTSNRVQTCERWVLLPEKFFTLKVTRILTKSIFCFFRRPFTVMPIPSSNLILLVKEVNCPLNDPHYKITLTPKLYINNSCSVPERPLLYRRRPASCISHHQNVSWINHRAIQAVFTEWFPLQITFSDSPTGIEHRSVWTWE